MQCYVRLLLPTVYTGCRLTPKQTYTPSFTPTLTPPHLTPTSHPFLLLSCAGEIDMSGKPFKQTFVCFVSDLSETSPHVSPKQHNQNKEPQAGTLSPAAKQSSRHSRNNSGSGDSHQTHRSNTHWKYGKNRAVTVAVIYLAYKCESRAGRGGRRRKEEENWQVSIDGTTAN